MSTTNLQTKYKISIFASDKKGIIEKIYLILILIIPNKSVKKKSKKNLDFLSGPTRARTWDHLIMSQVL